MRAILALLMFLMILSATVLAAEGTPIESKPKPDLGRIDLTKLYLTRTVGAATWSPDGRQIAFITNITGRANLWTVPSEGGWPVQLTVSDQRQLAPSWSPDGRWIVYQSDYNGNEQWDLFLVSVESGEVVNLTNTPEVAEQDATWSPDGSQLAHTVKPRTSSTHEIYVMDMTNRKARRLTVGTPEGFGNHGPRWSPDGRSIAYTRVQTPGNDSNIYLLDVASGQSSLLTGHEGEKTHRAMAWSHDGKRLLIESNALNGYDNVALLDVTTRQITWLTTGKLEISAGGWSPDGHWITWVQNNDGIFEIFLYDVAAQKAELLPLGPGRNSLGRPEQIFSRDSARILYQYNGPDRPNDIWVYDLRAKNARQITQSLVGGLRSEDLVEPYLVRYPSFDGRAISAFLYVPYNLKKDHSAPAVVYVHGGPRSQSVNNFVRPIQYLVNNGYVVIAPNYRGSSGYGKEFENLNLLDMGGGDLKDVVHAAEFLKTIGYVDPSRIVSMGASYGGYMTMMGVTKAPEVWAAGVAIVPFVNWFTEVEHEDPVLQQSDLATMGDPVKNKALWEDRSPINFVDRIKAPLIIFAGGNDPRCPKEEAEQVVAAIRQRGGTVEFKVYENEGHNFARVENQIDAFQRVVRFLDRYVKGRAAGAAKD